MRALVMAKAPVPGRVKTRLGAEVGMEVAAGLAAAALLDTIAACRSAFAECHLALDGDLDDAIRSRALRRSLAGWTVHPQRGEGLGERLAHAHADAAGVGPTIQVGMDTPQLTSADLYAVASAAADGDAVLGPAADGGWWVLALSDPTAAAVLADVPMSQPDTFACTREALTAAGQQVRVVHQLTDVDTVDDAAAVARLSHRRSLPPGLARVGGMTTLSLASVYTHALQGHPCTVWEGDLAPQTLPTHAWLAGVGTSDKALLSHCEGPTIDIGCGPGRMTEALALAGHPVLGIDIVPEAVRQTRGRGVQALRRSVFDRVPGEGRWGTALLADGNIGIGGDPVALLERARELVGSAGRVVVDVAPWGTGVVTRHVRLETSHGLSGEFPWTSVGADAIQAVADAAGLGRATGHRYGDRWWAVVEARP